MFLVSRNQKDICLDEYGPRWVNAKIIEYCVKLISGNFLKHNVEIYENCRLEDIKREECQYTCEVVIQTDNARLPSYHEADLIRKVENFCLFRIKKINFRTQAKTDFEVNQIRLVNCC